MALQSSIEWTEATWNPITGCSKISPGCKHCYAERLAMRLQAMGVTNYRNGFEVTLHEHALRLPLTWKTPQTIFVNSMSDLFHKDVPLIFIRKIFDVMEAAHWHRIKFLSMQTLVEDFLQYLRHERGQSDNTAPKPTPRCSANSPPGRRRKISRTGNRSS
jgi:protein gp37